MLIYGRVQGYRLLAGLHTIAQHEGSACYPLTFSPALLKLVCERPSLSDSMANRWLCCDSSDVRTRST